MLTLSMSCSKASLNDASGQILRFVPPFVLSLGQGGLVGMNKLPPGGLLSCQRYQCVIAAFLRRHRDRLYCRAQRAFLSFGGNSQTGHKHGAFSDHSLTDSFIYSAQLQLNWMDVK